MKSLQTVIAIAHLFVDGAIRSGLCLLISARGTEAAAMLGNNG
jgi:hypothetical protein